jgi:hypothetical protein
MRHATALLYHVCAVASRNIRFASCGTSGKLTLWTRYVRHEDASSFLSLVHEYGAGNVLHILPPLRYTGCYKNTQHITSGTSSSYVDNVFLKHSVYSPPILMLDCFAVSAQFLRSHSVQWRAVRWMTSEGRGSSSLPSARKVYVDLSFIFFSSTPHPAPFIVCLKCVVMKMFSARFDTRWGDFLNLPNPSGRTRPGGLLSL